MDADEREVDRRLAELTRRLRMRSNDHLSVGIAWASGAAGALALSAIHQVARRRIRRAPRMDVLGMRAIARWTRWAGVAPPTGRALYRMTLVADVVSNAAYYASVALAGRHAVHAGAALGVAAGLGAVVLPPFIGLGRAPHVHAWSNRLMTVAWYTFGGLVAGQAYRMLEARRARV